jgi:SAM-dependent methyltransferase
MIVTPQLRQLLEESFNKFRPRLSDDVTDEMAFPSYLRGNLLSRYFFWRKLKYVIRSAELQPEAVVFDFGCGSGILLPTLSSENRSVWATDLFLEPDRYLEGALKLSSVQFVEPGSWPESIPDRSFDVIIAANVLEHIDERKKVLQIFAQKLKPDGRLVISGPTENALYRMGRRLVGFSGDYHVSTIYDILAEVHETGFRRINQYKVPLFEPFCLYVIAAFGPAHP